MKNITLEEAIRNVRIAKTQVYDIECKVIAAKGDIPVGPPGMKGYNSVQECVDELKLLKVRFETAQQELEFLKSQNNSELAEELERLMATFISTEE